MELVLGNQPWKIPCFGQILSSNVDHVIMSLEESMSYLKFVLLVTGLGVQFGITSRVHFWKLWNCPSKMRAISKFSKIMRLLNPPKNRPSQICDNWSITPNQQTLSTETNVLKVDNYKSVGRQLQNNTVNGGMSITVNHATKVSEYSFKQNKNTLKTWKWYYIHIFIISP